MHKNILFLFLLLLCFGHKTFAQNQSSITGSVVDTASNAKLQNATIAILNAKDSTLYKFTRAGLNGAFSISPLKKGKFILLLSYPEYADFVYPFTIDSVKTSFDFKQINMKSKAKLLNEVIIKGQGAAIKIKGDTTEFNAANYTIQPNDKVEDLLKKLPGIQIDQNGKITAQGKAVPKVLVDGEEFFGDDPTLVTKNLRADMIDKVQLFEKSSDQAAFTGVDDGKKTQTINIKLKEDKKNGYFGKLNAGIGNPNFYEGQGMFNWFKAKQKFSVFGNASNTGKTGLGWQDAEKYGGGSDNVEYMEGGGVAIYYSDDDVWSGEYYGEGIPVSRSGGAHYDTKWNGDKQNINVNYKLADLGVKGDKNTLIQNNLPSGIINTNSNQQTDNHLFKQKLDLMYQIKLDTTSNLKINIDGTLGNSNSVNDFITEGLRGENNTLLNRSKRSVDNKGDESNFNFTAFYTKKLKKAGRNFSLKLSQNVIKKDGEGFLKSTNDFFDANGSLATTEIIDQFKTNAIKTASFSSNITYNEPLTKNLGLLLNYGLTLNNNKAIRNSFNASNPGNYSILDQEFSNDFSSNQLLNLVGAVFNYKNKKTVITWGTKMSAVNLDQLEAYTNNSFNRSFVNFLPQASYQYKFSAQKSIRFNYIGNTQQPTIEQLQPLKVNTDPLNIPLGNPDLNPAFKNNFNINYSSYKIITDQNIYLSGNFGFTGNEIVNNTVTDNQGRSIFQFINLTNKKPISYNSFAHLSRKIKQLGLNVNLALNLSGNTNYNYVNNNLNKTISTSFSPEIGLSKYAENKFNASFSFGPRYSSQQASLQKNVSNSGWGASGNGYFEIFLPAKIQLLSDFRYQYSPKTQSFNENFEQMIVNCSLEKSFLKSSSLKMALKVNDLLNQNSGFDRFAVANTITQSNFVTIRRYFMYSVSWDFNKMGDSKK
jgi:hypothetical protein